MLKTKTFNVPEEIVLIDACCMEDIALNELDRHPEHYFTTDRVIEEVDYWIRKERQPEVFDKRI